MLRLENEQQNKTTKFAVLRLGNVNISKQIANYAVPNLENRTKQLTVLYQELKWKTEQNNQLCNTKLGKQSNF